MPTCFIQFMNFKSFVLEKKCPVGRFFFSQPFRPFIATKSQLLYNGVTQESQKVMTV